MVWVKKVKTNRVALGHPPCQVQKKNCCLLALQSGLKGGRGDSEGVDAIRTWARYRLPFMQGRKVTMNT